MRRASAATAVAERRCRSRSAGPRRNGEVPAPRDPPAAPFALRFLATIVQSGSTSTLRPPPPERQDLLARDPERDACHNARAPGQEKRRRARRPGARATSEGVG